MKFSEKYGYSQARTVAQFEEMDQPLRNALWNTTYLAYFQDWDAFEHSGAVVSQIVWATYFHKPLSSKPDNPLQAGQVVQSRIMEEEWHSVYDLLEAILEADDGVNDWLEATYNRSLITHLAGYRIVEKVVTPLTDQDEIEEIEITLAAPERFSGARSAIQKALTLYSNRDDPDYGNSIKESISAVESAARELTGERTLGPALDALGKTDLAAHLALVRGWKAIYGYTSDTVRHGNGGEHVPSQSEARYFLITCSAFVNYLVATAT